MTLVKDIYNYINSIAPYNEMEEWDNSGFILGDGKRLFQRLLWHLTALRLRLIMQKALRQTFY